jgi:hypothetical protein
VSEIFPLEVRAQAIAVCFAIAQGFGALGPVIYGHLIGAGSAPTKLYAGYLMGAVVIVVGGIVEVLLGVATSPATAAGHGRDVVRGRIVSGRRETIHTREPERGSV